MSEPNRATATSTRRLSRREPLQVEALRDCITPILTSAVIARSLCTDRKAHLALDIIERQTRRIAHLLKEAFDVDTRPRLD